MKRNLIYRHILGLTAAAGLVLPVLSLPLAAEDASEEPETEALADEIPLAEPEESEEIAPEPLSPEEAADAIGDFTLVFEDGQKQTFTADPEHLRLDEVPDLPEVSRAVIDVEYYAAQMDPDHSAYMTLSEADTERTVGASALALDLNWSAADGWQADRSGEIQVRAVKDSQVEEAVRTVLASMRIELKANEEDEQTIYTSPLLEGSYLAEKYYELDTGENGLERLTLTISPEAYLDAYNRSRDASAILSKASVASWQGTFEKPLDSSEWKQVKGEKSPVFLVEGAHKEEKPSQSLVFEENGVSVELDTTEGLSGLQLVVLHDPQTVLEGVSGEKEAVYDIFLTRQGVEERVRGAYTYELDIPEGFQQRPEALQVVCRADDGQLSYPAFEIREGKIVFSSAGTGLTAIVQKGNAGVNRTSVTSAKKGGSVETGSTSRNVWLYTLLCAGSFLLIVLALEIFSGIKRRRAIPH